MSAHTDQEWLRGRASLGAAAQWTAEEMRVIADLGYALAEQGRDEEAVTVFEGLAALAPATAYFRSALGALKLRAGELEPALAHLNAALAADPADLAALTNRGEVYLILGDRGAAIRSLETALDLPLAQQPGNPVAVRARALLNQTRGPALLP